MNGMNIKIVHLENLLLEKERIRKMCQLQTVKIGMLLRTQEDENLFLHPKNGHYVREFKDERIN